MRFSSGDGATQDATIMPPFNCDLPYDIFYITATYAQMVTKVVIFYDTGIIFTARVTIIRAVFRCCGLTNICWVPDMCWLRMFLLRFVLYAINNCRNESVLSGVVFVSCYWSIWVGGFSFLVATSGWSSIRCLVSYLRRNHSSFSYHLVVLLISTPLSLWFPLFFPRPARPPWTSLVWPPLP